MPGGEMQELCLPRVRAFHRKLDAGEISAEPNIHENFTAVDRVIAERGRYCVHSNLLSSQPTTKHCSYWLDVAFSLTLGTSV